MSETKKTHMPVVIALLRGVNVGGHRKVPMARLRQLCETLGFRDPQTYVQSGNVVFRSSLKPIAKIQAHLELGIAAEFGFTVDTVLRTSRELQHCFAANPFRARPDIEPAKLLVTFLKTAPSAVARQAFDALKAGPFAAHLEELHLIGRELFIHFPNGMGKTKLSFPAIAKALGEPGTARNWNSVTKLLEMARSLEQAPERD
jgi:uncharacterized protein (DUF1697 family)